jgi:uncharacterized protein YfiM (DUF2279 family)
MYKCLKAFILCLLPVALLAQHAADNMPKQKPVFFEVPDQFHKGRFWLLTGTGAAAYTATVLGLSQVWYADYDRAPLHSFDDFGEWENMDKMGHLYTAYFYSHLATNAYHWTGISRRRAAWTGFGVSMFLQTTIEVLDGYSAEWGFSWGDMAFNTLGSSIYLAQELAWEQQKVAVKFSSFRRDTPDRTLLSTDGTVSTTLKARRNELFGTSLAEIMVKDYAATTLWASANLHSLFMQGRESRFPKWLNVAIGYGADNIYGARRNSWTDDDGHEFVVDNTLFPRKRQYYLALDVDLTKIPTQSRFLKVLLGALNTIKVPAPALEYNSAGEWRFHPFFF